MSIYRKVRAVERVFESLEKNVAQFQAATGMGCAKGCGLCCKKPDISATPLEFLPLAYRLYRDGQAYTWLEELQESPNDPYCKLFNPFLGDMGGGFCSHYQYRGLICRLFGFSAMLDKEGKAQLITCKTIKSEFPGFYQRAVEHVTHGGSVPVMRNFYFQLRSIDPHLGLTLMPVNQAILEALKHVLSYYSYRERRGA